MASTSSTPPTVVLITGANTGLGFETVKSLYTKPSPNPLHIILGARGPLSRAEEAITRLLHDSTLSAGSPASKITPLSIDITSDESINLAYQSIAQSPGYIDILVNNAGADFDLAVQSGRLTPREGFLQTWDVNVAGTHLLTEKLVPLLLGSPSSPSPPSPNPNPSEKKPAPQKRLIFLTSGMSSTIENARGSSPRYITPPPGWPKEPIFQLFGTDSPFPGLSYRASKSALNFLTTEWSRVLKNDRVKVFNISPGFLNTSLGKDRSTGKARDLDKLGALDPKVGGDFLADVVTGKRDEEAWPVRILRSDDVQEW